MVSPSKPRHSTVILYDFSLPIRNINISISLRVALPCVEAAKCKIEQGYFDSMGWSKKTKVSRMTPFLCSCANFSNSKTLCLNERTFSI